MENLIAICGVAFLVVFGLLALIALVMTAITAIFPEPVLPKASSGNLRSGSGSDPAVVAAVTAAVSAVIPGAHVVRVEEDR